MESRTLLQKMADGDASQQEVIKGNQSMIVEPHAFDEQSGADWKLNIDLRNAKGLPMTNGLLPQTFIEVSWSPTLDFDEASEIRQLSETVQGTSSPAWNQRLSLVDRLRKDQDKIGGSLWLRVIDATTHECLDKLSVPMTFLIPYRPMHFQVSMLDNEAQLYISLQLLVKQHLMPTDSLDEVTTIGLKWVNFDPLPYTVHQFSFFFGPYGYQNGTQLPFIQCSTRDSDSVSRAFFQ